MYIETLLQRNVWWGARETGKAELSVSKLNTCLQQASDSHQAGRESLERWILYTNTSTNKKARKRDRYIS